MTDKLVIQTWKLPDIFSKNEQNEPVTSRKTSFYLWPMTKYKLSGKNQNFGNLKIRILYPSS